MDGYYLHPAPYRWCTWIYAASNSDKEEAMKYDYLTRMKQWNQIIKGGGKQRA